MRILRTFRTQLAALLVGFLLGSLVLPVQAQSGPYAAQIQAALRSFVLSGPTFTTATIGTLTTTTGITSGPIQINGGSYLTNKNLYITGTLNHVTPAAVYVDVAMTGINSAGGGAQGMTFTPSYSLAGDTNNIVNLYLPQPAVTLNAHTLTNATTLKIDNAPSQGTNKRALWVVAGTSELDGQVLVGDGAAATPAIAFANATTAGLFNVSGVPHIAVGGADSYVFGSATFQTNTAIQSNGNVIIPSGSGFTVNGRAFLLATADKLVQITGSVSTNGLEINNGIPTLGTCTGGSMTSGSHNFAGQYTGNTSGSCVINFGTPNFTNTPFCFAMSTASTTHPRISASSNSSITVTGGVSGETIQFMCQGRVGT